MKISHWQTGFPFYWDTLYNICWLVLLSCRFPVGEGEYGEHDIVHQVIQYQEASSQNNLDFTPPTVHVAFFSGITQEVAGKRSQHHMTNHCDRGGGGGGI